MHITANNPVSLHLKREGGCVITGRADFWRADAEGWKLAGHTILQQVTHATEVQEIRLPSGSYTVVFFCRAEESINGVFDVSLAIGGTTVATKSGDVNTTSGPHDSAVYKNQFVLTVL